MTRIYHHLRDANVARQAEWDPDERITLAHRGNEMGGECGEAQNVIKKLERERLGIRGSRATFEDLADELADVVICADLVAMSVGIDLDQAIARKFNLTSEKQGLETRLFTGAQDDDQPSAFIVWNEGRSEGVIFTDLDREPGEPTAEDDAATASLGAHATISSALAEAFHEAFEDDNERPIERVALALVRGQ